MERIATFENTETENLTFIAHPDGYYEMHLHASTRYAVDEWIEKVDMIWAKHNGTDEPICIVTINDFGVSTPLNYAFKRGMQIVRKYRELPRSRSAFVLRKDVLLKLMDSFLRMMPLSIEYGYFDVGEDEKAIAWATELLKEKA